MKREEKIIRRKKHALERRRKRLQKYIDKIQQVRELGQDVPQKCK